MSYKDLHTMTRPFSTIAPAQYTADETGAGVDRKFNESAIAILHVGTWTDGTHDFTLEESDDNITFTAVDSSDIQGTLPTVEDATLDGTAHHIGYIGVARYLRVSSTVATATTGASYGVSIVQDYPRFSGASQLTPE